MMGIPVLVAVVAALMLAQEPTPVVVRQPPTIEHAKGLYATAAYEEALSLLFLVENGEPDKEVELYRALCLLALGRTTAAEQALQQLVTLDPLFRVDATTVSPRLVTLFNEVRARLLPASIRSLYVRGKANFDDRNFETATRQLEAMLALVTEAGTSSEGTWDELKLLAEGFLALMAPARVATPGPFATSSESPRPDDIFTPDDRDVTGPVEISRAIPPRVNLPGDGSLGIYQGLIAVVIDQRGYVEQAEIRRSITPSYDAALLEATREWRFQPAQREGVPVKYRRLFEVVARSQQIP